MPAKRLPKQIENAFERALAADPHESFTLRLYVAGSTAKSSRAIDNIKRFCEAHLHGRYDLEVIDLFQHPAQAKSADIIATPTLVKSLPKPLRKLMGDLSDESRVLLSLNIKS